MLAVGPSIVLAIYGYVYVRACFYTLLNSNTPIEYPYQTTGGTITFRAEAFQVDLKQNVIRLLDISAKDPVGQTLGTLATATVHNAIPRAFGGPPQPIRARGSDLFVRAERLEGGNFRLLDFVPERTDEGPDIPFEVQITGVRVLFEDRTSKPVWRRWISSNVVNAMGVGDRWVVSSRTRLQNIGVLDVEIRSDPDFGFSITGEAENLDLAPLLAHVVSTPDVERFPILKDVQARSLIASGPIRVFLPAEGEASFAASVNATATGLVYAREYAVDRGTFSGIVTSAGARGEVQGWLNGLSGTYVGSFDWSDGTQTAGAVTATIPSSTAAPRWFRGFFPAGMSFSNGRFSGWASYAGAGGVRVDGDFTAARATFSGETIQNPGVALTATNQRVAIRLDRGAWNGSPIRGALTLTPGNRRIEGLLEARNIPVQTVARRFNVANVQGTADVRALVSGTSTNPTVALRGEGTLRTTLDNRRLDLGRVEIAATFADQLLQLSRVSVRGPNGILSAGGRWNSRSNQLDMQVVARDLPLGVLQPDVAGTGSFAGRVFGTVRNPLAAGRFEAYDVRVGGQELPVVMADLEGSADRILARNLIAFHGPTRIQGDVAVNPRTQALDGTLSARGIQLSEWLGEGVSGLVNVTQANVSGTLSNPRANATLQAGSIVAQGVRLEGINIQASINDQIAHVSTATANINGGSITGSGTLNLAQRSGSFGARLQDVALERVFTEVSAEADLAGLMNADVTGRIEDGKLLDLQANGMLQQLRLNQVAMGGGSFNVSGSPALWKGAASVGTLERYFEVQNFEFNPRDTTLTATTWAHHLAIQDLYSAFSPYIAVEGRQPGTRAVITVPAAIGERLETLNGNIDGRIALSGPLQSPDVDLGNLQITDLQIDGRSSGTIVADANRTDEVWTINTLTWRGGPGDFRVRGVIDEHGAINLDGELNRLDTTWLALFEPNLARFTGEANLPFRVSGRSTSPVIDASLEYLENPEDEAKRRQLNVQTQVREGQITAEGNYYYDGLTGPLQARIPFQYPFTIPQDRDIYAMLSLPPRELASLAQYLPALDAARTTGTISGAVELTGRPADIQVSGGAQVRAEQLAFEDAPMTLRNVSADADFDGSQLTASAKAEGSEGGTVTFTNGRLNLGNLSQAISQSFDRLLENRVEGQLAMNDLRVVYQGGDKGNINATVGGQIDLGGSLAAPRLDGSVILREGSVDVPSQFPATAGGGAPAVNPQFNIALAIENAVTVRTGAANLTLAGAGSLGGSLSLPDLAVQLEVERGSIRLPNARISIEPGGTIDLTYRATPYGAAATAADVNLTGRTALTTSGPTGTPERYDINLEITGDLIREGGLQLRASSDPPDLSQDRILTLLGQGDILADRTAGVQPFRPERQIQSALIGVGLPYLTSGFTERLATSLGLDYLSVEYNPFEQFSIAGAIALSRNLILSARRQISTPLPGQRLQYEVKLSYRLPFRQRQLSRLRFNVGFDQDRPWRIGLEYSFRF